MGSQCSVQESPNYTNQEKERIESNTLNDSVRISEALTFRNQREYENKMKLFKLKISQIMRKVISLTEFKHKRTKLSSKLRNSNFKLHTVQSFDRLYDTMLQIYHKINTIYSNTFSFSKQELEKIKYELISKYMYYTQSNDYDEATSEVVNKVIKRLNFFTEEFPYKLNKLEAIIKSEKIYVFGYDSYYRLNFYIKPNFVSLSKSLSKKDNSISTSSSKSLGKISGNNFDFLIFIFFVIEFFIPLLKENFNFSDEVNIYIDFGGFPIMSELIIMILHYFSILYPFQLNRLLITNFIIEDLNLHNTLISQIKKEDSFNSVLLCGTEINLKILNYSSPNCVPIEYGGYHLLDTSQLDKAYFVDELIEYILSSILIKDS